MQSKLINLNKEALKQGEELVNFNSKTG